MKNTSLNFQQTYSNSHSAAFTYDAADRLTGWKVNSIAYTADYSGNGNITMKSDFGLYAYSGSKLEAGMYIYTLAIGGGGG